MNNDLISKILQDNATYWVISRRLEYNNSVDRSIFFIGLGVDVDLGMSYEEILLKDIDKLIKRNIDNIPLYPFYPPFQYGLSILNDATDGFPVKDIDTREFLVKALQVGTDSLYDYKAIFESMSKAQAEKDDHLYK